MINQSKKDRLYHIQYFKYLHISIHTTSIHILDGILYTNNTPLEKYEIK